jgi:hypothetical protein
MAEALLVYIPIKTENWAVPRITIAYPHIMPFNQFDIVLSVALFAPSWYTVPPNAAGVLRHTQ